MTRRVRLLHAAEADLARLSDFLVEVNPRAAVRIGELLEQAVLSLGQFSERAPVNADGVRTLTIRHGSGGYEIVYRVLDREVLVTRIFHTREDR
ncbi:MAG: type II toxin-antitoxin system RelE/ParE family toxin [Brevundimonas sp.]